MFHPQRPLIGLRSKQACQVWSFEEDAYVGQGPAKSCADWLETSGDSRAPDGRYVQRIEKGVLVIAPLTGKSTGLRVEGRALAATCHEVELARWSPDSQKIAAGCVGESRIYIIDARTGARLNKLDFDPAQRLQNLSWGAAGLVALLSPLFTAAECLCDQEKLLPPASSEQKEQLPGDVCTQRKASCKNQE